jgi:hypothetical protein
MSFEKHADERIREAIESGEFDDLPGKGKPLDLEAYFAAPEHLRMGYSILKNAEIIPEEVELLKEIEALRKSLEAVTNETDKAAIRQQLSEKVISFNMRMERLKKRRDGKT